MSKATNAAFGAAAVFNGVMYGFGTLLGVVVGIAALSNGLTAIGLIALAVGVVCAGIGYSRVKQAVVAAKNVNARQAARAAARVTPDKLPTQPIAVQPPVVYPQDGRAKKDAAPSDDDEAPQS